MPLAAIYARFSSENQNEATIQTQRNECFAYAERQGWKVVSEEYNDIAKSGKTDDRPAFQKLLKDASKKKFDIVLVRKLDRFSREKAHIALARIYQLLDMGIKIVSLNEPFDLNSPSGELALTNSIGYNRFYSRNLGNEIRSGLITTLKRGFWRGGEAPYGWKAVKVLDEATHVYRTKMEINEEEAKAIRIIFRLYAEGKTYSDLIDELMLLHAKPRKSKHWAYTTLARIFRNRAYIGKAIYPSKNPNEKSLEFGNVFPPILDEALFDKVQKRMDAQKKSMSQRRISGTERPFPGIAFCGICGKSFISSARYKRKIKLGCTGRKYAYMRRPECCDNRRQVDEESLVTLVKKGLAEKLLKKGILKEAFEDFKSQKTDATSGIQEEINFLSKKYSKSETVMLKYLKEFENSDGVILSTVKNRIHELDGELVVLKKKIDSLVDELKSNESKVPPDKSLESFMKLSLKNLKDLHGAEFRRRLCEIGVRIEIFPDRIKVIVFPQIEKKDPDNGSGNEGDDSFSKIVTNCSFPLSTALYRKTASQANLTNLPIICIIAQMVSFWLRRKKCQQLL